jgi:hypothetical protein
MPEFQQVVSGVIFAYGWPNILRGCLRGDIRNIYVLVERSPAPSGKLVISTVYAPAGGVDHEKEFKEAFDDTENGPQAEPYRFDIGQDVVRTVIKLKEIDAGRMKPPRNAITQPA